MENRGGIFLKQLFVATPMYGGQCYGSYVSSTIHLVVLSIERKLPIRFSFLNNESLVTRGRNTLTREFMSTDLTHLMFIDSDIGFHAEDVLRMIDADLDIVCGLYPVKQIGEPHFAAYAINNRTKIDLKTHEPTEIRCAGTGFMLIKREVLERLKDSVPTYTHDGFKTHEYFATSIDPETNELLSEDYHFCHIAREAGFKVWAMHGVKLTHTGTHMFS